MMLQFKRNSSKFKFLNKICSSFIALTFATSLIVPPTMVNAASPQTGLNLPAPGVLVPLSSGFSPATINGMTLHPEDPLKIDFLVTPGDSNLEADAYHTEASKLIRYFMAALTISEENLWVNLSPYEKDKIIPEGLDQTEMGRDMLAQDYILKQLTASLMYPEEKIGEKFWSRVRQKAYERFGTTEVPINTFNKIWIVPQKATVYENDNNVFVVNNHLKVMLEEDYLALQKNVDQSKYELGTKAQNQREVISGVSLDIIREVIIPEIEREVNEGATFAQLRQIYNSMILATWYKNNLRESLLGQVYANQNKVLGVEVKDKEVKQKIYNQYIQAFEKGVYNFVKEDYNPISQEIVNRKYFSGGVNVTNIELDSAALSVEQRAAISEKPLDRFATQVREISRSVEIVDAGQLTEQERKQEEARKNARNLIAPGFSIIALDEGGPSTEKKLKNAVEGGIPNTTKNSQTWRRMYMGLPLAEYGISGAILHDIHLDEYTVAEEGKNTELNPDGESLAQALLRQGTAIGWKADFGMKDDPNAELPGMKINNDVDWELLERKLDKYKAMGITFTKWRLQIPINVDEDGNYQAAKSERNLRELSRVLARATKLITSKGLAAIVEPETMITGSHSIEASRQAVRFANKVMFEEIAAADVDMESVVLKDSFVISGNEQPEEQRAKAEEVGRQTAVAKLQSVPLGVASAVQLSGGQGNEEGKRNLHELNAVVKFDFKGVQSEAANGLRQEAIAAQRDGNYALAEELIAKAVVIEGLAEYPWETAASYGRGYQGRAFAQWAKDIDSEENFEVARALFIEDALDLQAARKAVFEQTLEDPARLSLSPAADQAALETVQEHRKGGIDLNPNMLNLQIKRNGSGVALPVFDQSLENINIDGFLPVIINVAPVTNIPLLLGEAKEEETYEVSQLR